MKPKHRPLTAEQFDRLNGVQGWKLFEVPKEDWGAFPTLTRIEDTAHIYGSADIYDPQVLNDIRVIAGFDQLVIERNFQPNEPEGNAYHYVVQQTNHPAFPYLLHGPYTTETRVSHWHPIDQQDSYTSDDCQNE